MRNVAESTRSHSVVPVSLTGRSGDCSHDPGILSRFCQLQVKQIAAQAPIVWAKLVYYDPFLNEHQPVVSPVGRLDASTEADLQSQVDLADIPPALTLTQLPLDSVWNSVWKAYFCLIGYRNDQPEYLLVVANQAINSHLHDYLINCADLVSQHLNLHSNFYYQNTESQLLEQIVHRVGHQLRNPLSLISLYAENLRLELSAGREKSQASIIRDTVQDLLSNLNDLIYCGKSSQLRFTLQDIHPLITETIQELQPWIAKKQLTIVYAPVSVMLRVDRVQIKQVFINLLSNAIHFSPNSGTIYVTWQVFQGEVLIQITDQGQGLSDSDLKKIFTPFYSKRLGGTGLGLTIAKKIVLDHQGSLWGQNALAGGAQFSVTLPRD